MTCRFRPVDTKHILCYHKGVKMNTQNVAIKNNVTRNRKEQKKMAFQYKSKKEFIELDDSKKCYYLARLYIAQDTVKNTMPFKVRLFSCVNYLKKQPKETWSLLYNYLTDNKHNGLMIWSVVPKAVFYDQERRRTEQKEKNVKQYEDFSVGMLDEILGS